MFEYKFWPSRSLIVALFLPVVLELHTFHFVVTTWSIIPLSFHCCDEISSCRAGRHGRKGQCNQRESEANKHCQRLHDFPWVSSTKNSGLFSHEHASEWHSARNLENWICSRGPRAFFAVALIEPNLRPTNGKCHRVTDRFDVTLATVAENAWQRQSLLNPLTNPPLRPQDFLRSLYLWIGHGANEIPVNWLWNVM